jgi:hypothetical protein
VAAAERVAQDFAYCLVRGDFRQADPERGRFRDLVRTLLFHRVVNYQRQMRKEARVGSLPEDAADSFVVEADPAGADREFLTRWREELLDRTWEALEREQPEAGAPLYDVLRYRAEHPGTCSEQMAAELAQRLGRPLTAEAFASCCTAAARSSLSCSWKRRPGRCRRPPANGWSTS